MTVLEFLDAHFFGIAMLIAYLTVAICATVCCVRTKIE